MSLHIEIKQLSGERKKISSQAVRINGVLKTGVFRYLEIELCESPRQEIIVVTGAV